MAKRTSPHPPKPRAAPPYLRLAAGFGVWLVWWMLVGHRSAAGWLGIPAFLAAAESWPLFRTIYEVRAKRKKWVKPPGFWIAFYAVGSVWLALLLTAISALPWSGDHASATDAGVKIGGAISFAAAAWLAYRIGAGR